jgi:hypothetical protein
MRSGGQIFPETLVGGFENGFEIVLKEIYRFFGISFIRFSLV